MEYMTIKEAGEKWGISGRMVTYHCVAGRIPGVIRKGNMWLIPTNAEKPKDGRRKQSYENLNDLSIRNK